jgi:hypothetical protein
MNPTTSILGNDDAGRSTGYEIGDSQECIAEITRSRFLIWLIFFKCPVNAHGCCMTHINSARRRLRQVEEKDSNFRLTVDDSQARDELPRPLSKFA